MSEMIFRHKHSLNLLNDNASGLEVWEACRWRDLDYDVLLIVALAMSVLFEAKTFHSRYLTNKTQCCLSSFYGIVRLSSSLLAA